MSQQENNMANRTASELIKNMSVFEELTDKAAVSIKGGVVTVSNNPCPSGYKKGALIDMVNGNEVYECIPIVRKTDFLV